MTLQTTGRISLGDVQRELGDTGSIAMSEEIVRSLAGDDGGQISLSQLYGKSNIAPPGSQTFTSSGTFVVPNGYYTLSICMSGGGGGGCMSSVGQIGNFQSGAGGGGSGAVSAQYSCTPGESIAVIIGAGGVGGQGDSGTAGSSSYFGSIEAIGGGGGRATFGTSQALGGIGVNGGGNGGDSSWNVMPTDGGPSSSCGGSYPGGVNGSAVPGVYGGGGGGAGGFGPGPNAAPADGNRPGVDGEAGSGAGAAGNSGTTMWISSGNGGSGRCVISWA
jgi:hypothetical protein